MTARQRRGILLACATAAWLHSGCGPTVLTVPGHTRDIQLRVAFADFDRSQVASYSLTLTIGDGSTNEYFLTHGPSGFRWAGESRPDGDEMPINGEVVALLEARDINGQPLPIGGSVGPVQLPPFRDDPADDTDAPQPIVLTILVAPYDMFTPLDPIVHLRHARFRHTMSPAADTGLLVFGGAAGQDVTGAPIDFVGISEWLEPFTGRLCTSAGAGGCSWGSAPSRGRIHHIAVPLADGFGDDCPMRDAVLVGLGQAQDGAALSDLYLFDPAGLDGSGAYVDVASAYGISVSARIGAVAWSTQDCRVVIHGGHGSADPAPISVADLLHFSGAGVSQLPSATLEPATNHAAVFRGLEGADEIVVVGGSDETGAALSDVLLLVDGWLPEDPSTVTSATPGLGCGRNRASVVRLYAGAYPRALIVGDADEACGDNVELFDGLSNPTPPYGQITDIGAVAPTLPRAHGHSLVRIARDHAVLLGGYGKGDSEPTDHVDRFVPGLGLSQDPLVRSAAVGSFVELTPLTVARAHAATQRLQELAFVCGGWSGTAALSQVAVFRPRP